MNITSSLIIYPIETTQMLNDVWEIVMYLYNRLPYSEKWIIAMYKYSDEWGKGRWSIEMGLIYTNQYI